MYVCMNVYTYVLDNEQSVDRQKKNRQTRKLTDIDTYRQKDTNKRTNRDRKRERNEQQTQQQLKRQTEKQTAKNPKQTGKQA